MTALLLVAPVAAAEYHGNGGDGNQNVQVGVAQAKVKDLASNEADLELEYGFVQAAANCQFLVAVNTLVVNIAVTDQLALINASEDFAGVFGGRGEYDRSNAPNATATCSQDVGRVRIVVATADGWGEPAPVAEAAGSYNGIIGPGGGGDNSNVQVGVASAGLKNVVSNDADVELKDNFAAAASNCQFLAAANTLVLNVALVNQAAAIDDSTTVEEGDRNGETLTTQGEYDGYAPSASATSSCSLKIDTFELIIGDPGSIPPMS